MFYWQSFLKADEMEQWYLSLWKKTFAIRRKTILDDYPDLSTLFNDYPFLQECDQVTCNIFFRYTTLQPFSLFFKLMKELELIVGKEGAAEVARTAWKEMAPRVLEQAQLERTKAHIDTALNQVADIEGEEM